MSDIEEMTAEESAALEEMQNDTPVVAEEPAEAPQEAAETPEQPEQPEPEAETPEPEFKSQRAAEKPPEGFVPHQAMHAERMQRQTLQKQVEDLQAKLEALTPKEQAPEYVDPLVDPEGHKRWSEHQAQTTHERLEQIQRFQQQQAETARAAQRVSQYEQEYVKVNPDYADASAFLMQVRSQELANQGYSQQQIAETLRNDAFAIMRAGEQIGINPAQLAYVRAQEMGFTPKPAAQPAPDAVQAEQNKIQATATAQAATKGLGSATGGAQAGGLTVQQLAEMSEDDFAKLSEAEIAKVMDG